jgi:hypothetical protein
MTTPRERMLATLQGRPTDCIPFVPRPDLWYSANRYQGTLPDRYKKASLIEIVDDLDVGNHTVSADRSLYDDTLDIVDRALEHAIKSAADYETVAYIFEHAEVHPHYEGIARLKEEVGERALIVGTALRREAHHPFSGRDRRSLPRCREVPIDPHRRRKQGLLPCFVAGGVDIADAVCPAPMTSLTLKAIREAFAGSITIWGGIPSISVLENSMSDYEFDAYLDDLFVQIGKGDHLILSIADTAPPGMKFSRLERIARLAREFGSVIPDRTEGEGIPVRGKTAAARAAPPSRTPAINP